MAAKTRHPRRNLGTTVAMVSISREVLRQRFFVNDACWVVAEQIRAEFGSTTTLTTSVVPPVAKMMHTTTAVSTPPQPKHTHIKLSSPDSAWPSTDRRPRSLLCNRGESSGFSSPSGCTLMSPATIPVDRALILVFNAVSVETFGTSDFAAALLWQ